MKNFQILVLILLAYTSCNTCDTEITLCEGLSNNNILLVEYDSNGKKMNLGENMDSIKLYSGNKIIHLTVDESGLYSKRDSILVINTLENVNEFKVIFYNKNSLVDTLQFINVSSKIEDTKNSCDKKRTSSYPAFHSNSKQLIKSYNANCNNYVFELRR